MSGRGIRGLGNRIFIGSGSSGSSDATSDVRRSQNTFNFGRSTSIRLESAGGVFNLAGVLVISRFRESASKTSSSVIMNAGSLDIFTSIAGSGVRSRLKAFSAVGGGGDSGLLVFTEDFLDDGFVVSIHNRSCGSGDRDLGRSVTGMALRSSGSDDSISFFTSSDIAGNGVALNSFSVERIGDVCNVVMSFMGRFLSVIGVAEAELSTAGAAFSSGTKGLGSDVSVASRDSELLANGLSAVDLLVSISRSLKSTLNLKLEVIGINVISRMDVSMMMVVVVMVMVMMVGMSVVNQRGHVVEIGGLVVVIADLFLGSFAAKGVFFFMRKLLA